MNSTCSNVQFNRITVVDDTMFLAYINDTRVSIQYDQIIVWDTAPINPGGHYNTSTGGYTAPYDGYYQ